MGGSVDAGYEFVGRMLGCEVVVSGNMPTNLGGGTNETRIIAADMRDQFLWEDPAAPVFIRAEQAPAASLGVLSVIYSFSAFTAGRQPKSIAVVSGTGLILPTLWCSTPPGRLDRDWTERELSVDGPLTWRRGPGRQGHTAVGTRRS